jgi:ABC-type branched-subunit amino acid transport system substrate-binding protein
MPKLKLSRLALMTTLVSLAVLGSVVGASANSRRAHGADFKIMIISGFNTFSNANPEILQGALGAAAAINKAGGLPGGRMITVTPCGTQNSVTGDAACARQAVDQGYDNVIHRSSFGAGGSPILKAAGIPEIGMVPTLTGDYIRNGNIFPVTTTSQALFVAAIAYELKTDKTLKKWAAVGVQNSGSDLTLKQTKLLATKNGRTFVGAFELPIVASPDMLPTAQALAQLAPDAVVCSCPVGYHVALDAAWNSLGFFPKVYISNTPTLTPDLLSQFVKLPALVIGGSDVPPVSATSSPLVKAFLADMTAAGLAGDPLNLDAVSEIGWLDVRAIGQLAALLPKGTTATKELLIKQIAKVTTAHPINLYNTIMWAPGSLGPAAVPNNPNGLAFANRFDPATKQYVLASPTPIDAWKYLGIARK